jgi:hypothetical protein
MTLIYFLPKNEIVSFIQADISQKYQIDTTLKLENKIFGYKSTDTNIAYQNNPTALIKEFELSPYLFFNTITLSKIKLQGMAGSIFPSNIESGYMEYSVLNPTKVLIDISGDFGKAIGYFDILNFTIHLEVTPSALLSKNYSFILKNMKKTDKNYIYEYKL